MSESKKGVEGRERERQLAQARKHTVEAPAILCVHSNQHASVTFLGQIHDQVCNGKLATMVDLRTCEKITPEGCLLLTAELERCVRRARTVPVWVTYPKSPMCDDLDDFGFFSHLKMGQPVRFTPPKAKKSADGWILVRSGTKEEITLKLRDIAAVTDGLYGDSVYAEQVEIALQEAMTNVMSHAFPGPDEAQQPARWWFAGRTDEERGEAVFYALDLGVGIPARAPATMGEEITEYWLRQPEQPKRMRDKHVLEAAVNARRKAHIEVRTNNGLPAMIGLVETDSASGSVHIASGRAGYQFEKKGHENGHPVSVERCYGYRRPFPGTLVVWRVAGPAKA